METGKEQCIQKFRDFLRTAKGSTYDKSAVIYEMICVEEDSKEAFRCFLEIANYIDSSEEKEVDAHFTAQQLRECEKEYSNLTDAILTKLINKNYDEKRFYDELWENVIKSDVNFDTEDAKIYVIGRLWSDARIPYFRLGDGIKMSNDDFSRIIEENKKLVQEARFILGCKYEQKTEISSRLLELLNKCSNDTAKVVVMAVIIDLIERRSIWGILNRQEI